MTTWLEDLAEEIALQEAGDWRHRAACREEDPELFFAVGISPAAKRQRAHAKAVCQACPVMADCRAWAFAAEIYDGVWGGLDEEERLKERRRTATPPAARRPRNPRQVGHYPKRHDDR
jgi:WhiB family transcriptional regulator, redox-sensing transcriptional regulator